MTDFKYDFKERTAGSDATVAALHDIIDHGKQDGVFGGEELQRLANRIVRLMVDQPATSATALANEYRDMRYKRNQLLDKQDKQLDAMEEAYDAMLSSWSILTRTPNHEHYRETINSLSQSIKQFTLLLGLDIKSECKFI